MINRLDEALPEGVLDKLGYRGAAEGMKRWPCLGQKRPSILGPCLEQTIVFNDDISCNPVQGREGKNHILSSGTSPYSLHKGVCLCLSSSAINAKARADHEEQSTPIKSDSSVEITKSAFVWEDPDQDLGCVSTSSPGSLG